MKKYGIKDYSESSSVVDKMYGFVTLESGK
jgi:hypothetical protein